MISRIIQSEVNVICRSRRLREITLTEAWIILDSIRKSNPIIVLYNTIRYNTINLLVYPKRGFQY